MLTRTRTQLQTLAALIVAAVLCEVVAHATNGKHGLAGAVSWITFIGFWVAVIAALAMVVLTVITLARGRRTVQP
jgi:transcriptional regulator of met regulon